LFRMKGVFLFLLLSSQVFAFVPTFQTNRRASLYLSETPDLSSAEYLDSEIEEMRDLVWSLSLEPTDESRRQRLRNVFHEALAGPNGMPARFSFLFDQTLTRVGEQVQMEAKKKFFEAQAAQEEKEGATENDDGDDDDDRLVDGDDDSVPKPKEKTPDELQLWALVDMLVQSKTIVKRNNRELGSKGTFQ
jgi:hypothetical protein